MAGRGAWVWYANACGSPEAMVALAREVGLTHVVIKAGDGAGYGDRNDPEVFRRQTVALLPRLQDAGLRVLTWSYCYLDDPEGEAAVAGWALAQGSDGHVFDVEGESEGKPEAAVRLLTAVRAAHPDAFLAYAPLPVIDLHLRLPYWQFNAAVQAVCPQFYPTALGAATWPLDRLFAMWDRWSEVWWDWGGPAPALTPLVEGYFPESAAVIARLGEAVRARRLAGVSLWSWQHATPEVWRALAALPFA